MVERFRSSKGSRTLDVKASFSPKKGMGVGRASIKKSTIAKAARDEKKLLGSKSTKDAFQNFGLNIGLGTNNALSQSQYGFTPITRIRTLLDFIYRGSWLGGIAVNLLADDMTRGGVEILTIEDTKNVEKMQQAITRLKIWTGLGNNIKWSQLYGGSIAVLLIDGQDPSTPLRIDAVGKDKFKGLTVFDRWMVEPDLQHLVDEYGPHLGLPMFYKVTADAPAMRGQRIHYSRCIRLEGVELPHWQRVQENLWGISVFERLYDRMIAFDSATMGAAQLVYKSFMRTYKISGLAEAATSAGDALAGIANRVELMRKYQGIEGISLLDSEDDFTTHESSGFTGIADILVHFAEQISGALQVPLVRLLGQSPAGLNSTGESDLRTYYDNILKRQESDLREGMNLILRVLARSLSITLPDNFNFNFVPLWQMDQTEKTDTADKATKFIAEIEAAGLVSEKVALQELRQLSKMTGYWTNISNEDIANASDVAEPPEMPGMEGGEEDGEEPGEAKPGEGGKPPPKGEKPPPTSPEASIQGEENFKKVRKAFSGGGDAAPRFRRIFGSNTRDDGYSLPFTEIGGLQIVIEQRAGSIRRGEGWSVVLPADYGYIRRIGSAEGEEEWLDCFVGPWHSSRDVWIIDAMKPADQGGGFDEHKLMTGFKTSREALAVFNKAYNDGGARRVGAVTHLSMDSLAFKDWIASGDKHVAYAPELRQAA